MQCPLYLDILSKIFHISLCFYALQIPTSVHNFLFILHTQQSYVCSSTSQWSLYVPHIGHYMYRTLVTICTAHWSLYVPHSGHYMYRQWSLYVPHSGHYMYRTVVTICTISSHYMYRTVVTMCTTSLTFNNSTFCPHTVFMCFVWISEQTAIISLYNIN